MIPSRPSPHRDELRTLVAEQPGLRFSFLLISIALFVGLAFRSTFSPERISALIDQAAQRIDPRLHVTFESAALSLSDGLFPELAVVVENIQAESAEECWMRPQLKIDQMRLPLRLSELLRGRVQLATVVLDHVEVDLRSEKWGCGPPTVETPVRALPPPSMGSPDPQPDLEVKVEKTNPVENVVIRSLHVQSTIPNWMGLQLRRVKWQTRAGSGAWSAQGTAVLPIESWAGTSPQADFEMTGANFPAPLNFNLTGFWREGSYQLRAKHEPDSRLTDLSLRAQHLPIGPLTAVLHRWGILDREFPARQAWVSVDFQNPAPQVVGPKSQWKVNEFRIEGDLGEVDARDLVIQQVQPLVMDPLRMSLRGVRADQLFSLLDVGAPSPVLGELGTFNGELRVRSPQEIELTGEHSGLQFVFSNRGQREMQTLNLISGNLQLKNEQWILDVDRVRPQDGLFLGKVHAQTDRQFRKWKVKLDVDELALSPSVQRLMTGGGSLGRWSGNGELDLDSGRISQIRGQWLATDLLIENLAVDRGQVQVKTTGPDVRFELQGKRVRLAAPSPLLEAIRPFLASDSKEFESEQIHFLIESRNLEQLRWKLWPVKVGSVLLRSEGQWNEDASLSGELVQNENNHERRWRIRGTRASPQFESGHSP